MRPLWSKKQKKLDKIYFYFIKVFWSKILNRIIFFVLLYSTLKSIFEEFLDPLHNAQYNDVTIQESSFPFKVVSFHVIQLKRLNFLAASNTSLEYYHR